jgi:hypothetical protein
VQARTGFDICCCKPTVGVPLCLQNVCWIFNQNSVQTMKIGHLRTGNVLSEVMKHLLYYFIEEGAMKFGAELIKHLSKLTMTSQHLL